MEKCRQEGGRLIMLETKEKDVHMRKNATGTIVTHSIFSLRFKDIVLILLDIMLRIFLPDLDSFRHLNWTAFHVFIYSLFICI